MPENADPMSALREARAKLLRMADAARDDTTANIAYTAFREAAQIIDAALRASLAPETREDECHIEPAFSLHEYAVSYCDTHDQPADQCRAPSLEGARHAHDFRDENRMLVGQNFTVRACACGEVEDARHPEPRYVDPTTLPDSFYRRNPDYQGEDVIEGARNPEAGETDLRARIEAVVAEHASGEIGMTYARFGGDALLHDLEAVLTTASPGARHDDPWTQLANDIRTVDGNHDLGAGELAARLIERGWVPGARHDVPGELE